ncbi:MAG: zinc ribbon domain-containing protein [Deltaproteobacteria bacterium]|nr:zinc ribbon domain-containing protein [Deltaproteobacteria bacterium]
MPIYEFRCTDCGHVFEELVLRSSDQQDPTCPRCGVSRVERVLSACCVGRGGGAASVASSCVPGGGFS